MATVKIQLSFFFECIARYLLLFKGLGVYFSKYGLVSGIFGKMDFVLALAKNWPKKLVKNIIAKNVLASMIKIISSGIRN